jgi:hypothetical protein
MSNTITGTIKVIKETQTFNSGFTKREFVVTTDEQYPQDIKLGFIKDKCSLLDNYKVGQPVTVDFNLRGNYNEGLDRYFVELQAWRIGSNSEDGTEVIAQAARDNAQPSGNDGLDSEPPF